MKPTVFYDGQCPLCNREIAHYRGLDRNNVIHFVDVHQNIASLSELGVSFEHALKVIHGVDQNGQVISGVDVFLMIWSNIYRYRLFSEIVVKLKLTALLQWAYQRFAGWRYKQFVRNRTCSIKRNCQEP